VQWGRQPADALEAAGSALGIQKIEFRIPPEESVQTGLSAEMEHLPTAAHQYMLAEVDPLARRGFPERTRPASQPIPSFKQLDRKAAFGQGRRRTQPG